MSNNRTHIYFVSDFHLGVPNYQSSLQREKRVVKWLDSIAHNAKAIYLVGDVFDFCGRNAVYHQVGSQAE